MPARKRFSFKIHSKDGTFLGNTEDWELEEIASIINGSMEARIKTDILTSDIDNQLTAEMNQITITIASPLTGSEGVNYFSGYIPKRGLILAPNNDSVSILVRGHGSRLFDTVYRDGTTTTMDFSSSGAKASDIAKDVIDKFQVLEPDWPVDYTAGSVEDTADTVKDKFKLQQAGDVIQRCVFLAFDTSRVWFTRILGDNIFTFKKASTTADHTFTFGKDVSSIDIVSDLEQMRNEIFVQYNGGGAIKRVADEDSITEHGHRSLVVTENNVPNVETATEIGNAYLSQLLRPTKVRIIVTDDYAQGIETVKPGDTCKINNLKPSIAAQLTDNLITAKVVYFGAWLELELSLQNPLIGQLVDKLRQRLQKQETDDMTATSYS